MLRSRFGPGQPEWKMSQFAPKELWFEIRDLKQAVLELQAEVVRLRGG